jgi:competence protein ComEA
MDDHRPEGWRGMAAWLSASPAEIVGLLLLGVGGLALVGVLWLSGHAGWPGPDSRHGAGHGAADVPGPTGLDTVAGQVLVHVAGAVLAPGLVEVPTGARIADAIAAAGGTAPDADPGRLNLARPVMDGERIDVPRIGDDANGHDGGASGATGGGIRPDGRVDLNLATAEELQTLPGVGPVLASRIVSHRDQHGPFVEVSQLRQVSGIGDKTFQKLAELVTV